MGCVYILTDPRFPEGDQKHIRYVGITTRNLDERMVEHLRASTNTYRDNWIRHLRKNGLQPCCVEIESFEGISRQALGEVERYWIAQFKAWGFKLTNMTSGGDGVFDIPKDVNEVRIAKLSETKKRQFAESPELRKAQADRAMAWRSDDEIVAKWKASIKASWSDPDVKQRHLDGLNKPDALEKISKSSKATWADPVKRERITESRRGGNNWKARAVVHRASGRIFDSSNCAEKWLRENGYPRASGSAILRACKGQLDVIYGSQWQYAGLDFVPFKPKDLSGSKNPGARPVICIETNEYFGCMLDAVRWALRDKPNANFSVCTIWRVCNKAGKAKTAHGYKWRYATDEEIAQHKIVLTSRS